MLRRVAISPERAGSTTLSLALAISLGTGVSRAYADAHWTTDVVGGWALGGTSAVLCALYYEQVRSSPRI